jgi:hypothetical protein
MVGVDKDVMVAEASSQVGGGGEQRRRGGGFPYVPLYLYTLRLYSWRPPSPPQELVLGHLSEIIYSRGLKGVSWGAVLISRQSCSALPATLLCRDALRLGGPAALFLSHRIHLCFAVLPCSTARSLV